MSASAPIQVQYRWTFREFLSAQTAHLWNGWGRFRELLGAASTTLLLIYALYRYYDEGDNRITQLLIAFGVCWFFLRPLLRRILLWFSFRGQPTRNQQIQLTFDHTGIHSECGENRFHASWELCRKVIETRDGFLLYQPGSFLWMPWKGFIHDDDTVSFRTMVRERLSRAEH